MGKHEKTHAAIFADPVRANVLWSDIEALFLSFGAEVSEGRGSRVLTRFFTARTRRRKPTRERLNPFGAF